MARKFIIQDDYLSVGNVEMHFELKSEISKNPVIGGGYWYIDKERTTLYLYGKSIDFGKVTIDELRRVKTKGMSAPSIQNLQWKWFDSDNISDVLERGVNILEYERGISIAIIALKSMLSWSDRLGSDEIHEINEIIKILENG